MAVNCLPVPPSMSERPDQLKRHKLPPHLVTPATKAGFDKIQRTQDFVRFYKWIAVTGGHSPRGGMA